MRFVWASVALAALAATSWAGAARAQVNLPPPPPPPLTNETPPPPPPSGNNGSSTNNPPPRRPRPTQQPTREPVRETRETRPAPAEERWEPRGDKQFSVRFNPLALFVARASVDFEWMFLPRHALVVAPHLSFAQDRGDLARKALGFMGPAATGFGVELGYRHYFAGTQPEGLFIGPSLLLDSTKPAARADRFSAYGGAFDVGYQVILGSGFTMNAGGGLLVIGTKGASAQVAPRILFGIGWSF